MSPIRSVLLALAIMASGIVQAGQIDKATINNMLSEIDAAAQRKDASVVVKYISPDAKIIMNIKANGQQQVLKISRAQYLDMLRQGWAAANDYKYQRNNTRIKILAGGTRAVVSANVVESMTIQGQVVKGSSKERSTIELINGKVMITELVGDTEM